MAYLDSVTTIRDQLVAKMVEVSADPKPTYAINGQSVSHSEYFMMLTQQVGEMNKLIAAADPFFIVSSVM